MFENGLKAKMLSCHHTLKPSSTMRSTWFKLLGHDLLSPTFSILGSSSPERTEITQFISKLTQRRSVGEKRSDFFFARALFIQLKLGLKRWRDIGWRAIPPAWREKKNMELLSPGGGNGNPLQYSCLKNPMDRGAWRTTVQRVAKNQTWLSS